MMISKGDTTIVMVNSKFAEISGYRHQDIEGKKSWQEFVHPEDLDRMLNYHRRRRDHGDAPRQYEFRFRDRWGGLRWMLNTVEMVPGTDYAVASLLDISDRKRTEERERERLRRLQRQRTTLVQLSTHPSLASGDLEQAARVVTEAVARTMEVDRVNVWLLEDDDHFLRCLDSYDLKSGGHSKLPSLEMKLFPRYYQALKSERSIAAYDVLRDPRTSELAEPYLKPAGVRSMLDAGIRLSGRVRGVICLNRIGEHREWGDDEIGFVAEIADQMAQALLNQERRRAQEALRESHERYRTFLEHLPDPVVVYDMEGRAQYLNSAFEETFGWTRQELLNRRIDFVPPECREETQAQVRSMKAGLPVKNFESKRLTKDGRLLRVSISNSPYYDQDGVQAGNIVILRDITALTQAQDRLRESEERYRYLVENSPYGLLLADLESGRLLFVNRQLAEMFGYSPEESMGKTIWDAVEPSEHEAVRRQIKQRLEGKPVPQGRIYTGRRKDGSRIRFQITVSMVPITGKQVLQGIVRDVTNEELMERQLQQAQKMEAVGTLAGGVAHEFNNILMAIRGYSQLLTKRPDLDPVVRKHLDKIAESTRRAADLADTMLSFSRPETGKMEPVDLNQVLKSLQGLLRRTLPPNIEQRLELSEDLPLTLANPNHLEQVLLNLAVNARDAMPRGGTLTLRTGLRRADEEFRATRNWASEESYVVVEVEDTGHGMDEAIQARIFEPFYTTKEPGRGTGLGLFVAYSMITNHRGAIEVTSTPGSGTRFRVFLPADTGLHRSEQERQEAQPLPRGRGERVLVVDDEASVREIIRQALESFGYRVTEASNGREALALYQKHKENNSPFYLVILDLAMPIMDGEACFHKLTSLDPAARVLIATGHSHNQDGVECLEPCPAGVIKKPFDLSNLLGEVRRVLGSVDSGQPN